VPECTRTLLPEPEMAQDALDDILLVDGRPAALPSAAPAEPLLAFHVVTKKTIDEKKISEWEGGISKVSVLLPP
jgi:hypothetical protein